MFGRINSHLLLPIVVGVNAHEGNRTAVLNIRHLALRPLSLRL